MADRNEIVLIARLKDEASKEMKSLASSIQRHSQTIRRASLAAAAGGAAIGFALLAAAKASLDEERGIRSLDLALQSVGESYDNLQGKLEASFAATQRLTNFGDTEQRKVLATLVTVTGDFEKAFAALPAVLDAAAFSGFGVHTIARTLGSALVGTTNMAASLGIKFDETADFADRLAIVLQAIGGQANAAADPILQLTNSLGDVVEAVGKPLIPLLEDAATQIRDVGDSIAGLDPALLNAIGKVGIGLAGTLTLTGGFGLLLLQIPNMIKGFGLVKSALLAVGATAAGIVGTLALLAAGLTMIGFGFVNLVKNADARRAAAELAEEREKLLQGLDNQFNALLRKYAEQGLIELTDEHSTYLAAVEATTAGIDDLTASTNALNDAQAGVAGTLSDNVEMMTELGKATKGMSNIDELVMGPGGLREQWLARASKKEGAASRNLQLQLVDYIEQQQAHIGTQAGVIGQQVSPGARLEGFGVLRAMVENLVLLQTQLVQAGGAAPQVDPNAFVESLMKEMGVSLLEQQGITPVEPNQVPMP